MGQILTQQKLSVVPEIETFLYKYQPQLQFYKNMSDSIFLKTALVTYESDGEPLVCKIYFKREFSDSESKLYTKHINSLLEIKDLYNIHTSPNVAPILLVNDNVNQKAGLIIRQYYSFNLKERIASMPYLTQIEKKWISFQIIYGLTQIHNKGLCHGDIKLENILLSSNGSVFLCDLAPYKPAYIQSNDNSSFAYYFGTNSSIKSCYLAPERLVDKQELNDLNNSIYKLTTGMDIFSAGAVIAELFLEDLLFDHEKLLLFKSGKLNLEFILRKIKDPNLENLLLKMMKINPSERIELSECFKYLAEEICPISFSRMLIHFNTLIVSYDYWKSDKRIGLIYKHWRQIWKVIYGPDSEVPELYQNLNNIILNRLILDNRFTKLYIENNPIIFDLQNDDLLLDEANDHNLGINNASKFKDNNNSDSSIIIVNLILNGILSAKYATSKIVAMEILRAFSTKLPDIMIIQLIIPYMVKLLKDQSNLVRLTALNQIISMLYRMNESELILPSSDYNFFDAYIFPSILELYSSNEPSQILAFANILDKLTELEQKFLNITLRSRFHNMKNQNNEGGVNSVQQSRQTFTFHTINSNRDKGEEIIHAYDSDFYEFKSQLFRVIENIFLINDDIDIQQVLIRKLPNLILFFGKRKIMDFSKFIINQFNKKEWIIHKQIFKSLPSLSVTLGETILNQMIVPTTEMIIFNNFNELKILELINSMQLLLNMEYLETSLGINFLKKILPLIMHPNLWIRNEVINFASTLISHLSQGEVFTYLRPDLKNYLCMPLIIITPDLLKKATKSRLSRVIYELACKNINYFFLKNEEDEAAFFHLNEIIKLSQESRLNDGIIKINKTPEVQITRLKAILEETNVMNIVKKEFSKFIKYYSHNHDDLKILEKAFLGKLISLSNILPSITLPCQKNRRISVNFSTLTDNILSQENFKLKYLFKALDIIIREDVLEEFETVVDDDQNRNNQNLSQNSNRSPMLNPNIVKGNSNSQTMSSWRPQGKLLGTFYEHESNSSCVSVERLLNLNIENMNKFLSFGSDGKIILWDVIGNENDVSVEKIATNISKDGIQYPNGINYSNSVCNVEFNQFATSYKNQIESAKSDFCIQNTFKIQNPDENDICALICNYRSQESRKLVYCNQKGKLQIQDLRNNKSSLKYDIGVQKGLVSSLDYSKDERCLYLGTLGGYILKYDFRLNSIIDTFKYNENTPIIGIKSYLPCKGKEYDLYSMNINPNFNKYLLIWTAANDHEMGLWNEETLNCDMIFKVNPLQGTEIKPLPMEIPCLYKEDLNIKDPSSNIEMLYRNLIKNSTGKNLIINNISSCQYSQTNNRIPKLSNIFDNSNTVQVAISPFNLRLGENVNNNWMSNPTNENSHFILSAGNDMTIRYWDISKEGLYGQNGNPNNKRSFLVNAPNKIDNCLFNTSTYDSTVILQSNEFSNTNQLKKDIPGFSEYQNYNGTNYHGMGQCEFVDVKNTLLKFCTKMTEPSHRNIISDLMPMNLCGTLNNLLFSSSWDGTIKMWK